MPTGKYTLSGPEIAIHECGTTIIRFPNNNIQEISPVAIHIEVEIPGEGFKFIHLADLVEQWYSEKFSS